MQDDDANEIARQQYLESRRLLHDAYTKLFGMPGNINPIAQVVLDDIDKFCKRGDESIHMDREGRMDPFTTIYRDGKKSVADRIHKLIEWSNDGNGN
jgi:hypothetical protein